MRVEFLPTVDVSLKLVSDESVMTAYVIREGDKITDLTYVTNGQQVTVDCIVDAIPVERKPVLSTPGQIIDGRSTSPEGGDTAQCPVSMTAPFTIGLTGMVVDVATALQSKHLFVRFEDIVSIGTIGAFNKTLVATDLPSGGFATTLGELGDGANLILAAGTYESALSITKSIAVVGPNDVPQKAISTLTDEDDLVGAVINGAVTVNSATADVEFRGLTFTGASMPNITAANSVTFINCRFERIDPTEADSFIIKTAAASTAKLVVKGCYFGDPKTAATGSISHVIDLEGKLKTGSSFLANSFSENCCTGDILNMYDVVDGANIIVSDNIAVKSATMVHVGFKGAVTARVLLERNEYSKTSTVTDQGGLVRVQPYNTDTTTMAGWSIVIADTKNTSGDEQLVFAYFSDTETAYSAEIMPNVFIDGVKDESVKVVNSQTPAG